MKNSTKWLIGGVTVAGLAGIAIYFATRPKTGTTIEDASKGAVQGAVQGGMQIESTPVTPPPTPGQQQKPPPVMQLSQLSQLQQFQ